MRDLVGISVVILTARGVLGILEDVRRISSLVRRRNERILREREERRG